MRRKSQRKQKKQTARKNKTSKQNLVTTNEVITKTDIDSKNIVRLKLTTRKGTRIESVPLKKLEQIASRTKLLWELKDGWLILYGLA